MAGGRAEAGGAGPVGRGTGAAGERLSAGVCGQGPVEGAPAAGLAVHCAFLQKPAVLVSGCLEGALLVGKSASMRALQRKMDGTAVEPHTGLLTLPTAGAFWKGCSCPYSCHQGFMDHEKV